MPKQRLPIGNDVHADDRRPSRKTTAPDMSAPRAAFLKRLEEMATKD
jgi:hypothetical protein